jgi:HD superfamily phosphodiesterase
MPATADPPRQIAGVELPTDARSLAAWHWAERRLPRYLFAHSVRVYVWAATLARDEGLAFQPPILWPAALLHDIGLTRIPRNTRCFEYAGADLARRVLTGQGMAPDDAAQVGRAIELHMAPSVTMADGVESVLLDRATAIDVRGAGIEAIGRVRDEAVRAFPRGLFDRQFLAGIRREVAARPGCQSERLLGRLTTTDTRSPWTRPVRPGRTEEPA